MASSLYNSPFSLLNLMWLGLPEKTLVQDKKILDITDGREVVVHKLQTIKHIPKRFTPLPKLSRK